MIRRRKESDLTDGLRILPAVNLLCGIHFLIDPCRSRIQEKSPDLGQGRGLLKINGAALRGWGAGFSGLAVGNNPTIHNWFLNRSNLIQRDQPSIQKAPVDMERGQYPPWPRERFAKREPEGMLSGELSEFALVEQQGDLGACLPMC